MAHSFIDKTIISPHRGSTMFYIKGIIFKYSGDAV